MVMETITIEKTVKAKINPKNGGFESAPNVHWAQWSAKYYLSGELKSRYGEGYFSVRLEISSQEGRPDMVIFSQKGAYDGGQGIISDDERGYRSGGIMRWEDDVFSMEIENPLPQRRVFERNMSIETISLFDHVAVFLPDGGVALCIEKDGKLVEDTCENAQLTLRSESKKPKKFFLGSVTSARNRKSYKGLFGMSESGIIFRSVQDNLKRLFWEEYGSEKEYYITERNDLTDQEKEQYKRPIRRADAQFSLKKN